MILQADLFVFMLGDCVNFKAKRYELSANFNRIVGDKLHRVTPS